MWRVFHPPQQNILYSRNVVFFENRSYYKANADKANTDKVDVEDDSVMTSNYEN